MKAIILAAGYATRLYPLTKEYPKPLLLVQGRPIIEYIIDILAPVEAIDEIIIVTNSKFIQLFRSWRRSHPLCGRITLVDDLTSSKEDRRGAIGDMHFVIQRKRLKEDVLVIGGDNIFDGDLRKFLSFARSHRPYPAIGVYDVKKKELASHYGVIALDKGDKITDFEEKPHSPETTLVAMCLYFFPAKKLGLVNDYVVERKGYHDAIGLYIDWLRTKESVYGYVFKGRWYDIGHHATLQEAKQKFRTRKN